LQNSLISVVEQLLSKNRIFFDKSELDFQIQSHPSFPSLHAVTGVLDHFNIENVAVDVPVNSETIQQLPECFIAQIITDKGKDLVTVERKNEFYFFFNSSKKNHKYSESEFLKKITGIVVAVEKPETNKQIKPSANLFNSIGLFLLVVFSTLFLVQAKFEWFNAVHLLLSLAGIIISVAILKQELGLQTIIGNAFCSDSKDKKSCDAVLTSKGAEIFKDYKLSDLSLLYFISLFVFTFIEISNPIISFTVSLLAIPFTVYSLYYQYKVIQKWCFLCLSIVAVLWLQALIPVLTNTYINELNRNSFFVFSIVILSIGITWSYLKSLYNEVRELKKDKIRSTKFKKNFDVFQVLLNKSSQINTNVFNSNQMVFGNQTSNLEITIVTNPYCGHCKPLHHQIENILNKFNNDVRVVIRFNVRTHNMSSDIFKITHKLIELYNEDSKENTLEAMRNIYDGMLLQEWLEKWGDCSEKEKYKIELEKQQKWCAQNAINFTPKILINGKSFPKEYDRKDLIFFIEDLLEEQNFSYRSQNNNLVQI